MISKKSEHLNRLSMAELLSDDGTCRRRNYGAVLVDRMGKVVSIGTTSSVTGEACKHCIRESGGMEHGSGSYEFCNTVHAEQMALINAPTNSLFGGTLYLGSTGAVDCKPCYMCMRMLKYAGVATYINRRADGGYEVNKI